MSDPLRAVLDTNIILAAQHSRSAESPNREILARFSAGEFTGLYSDDVIDEYLRKLTEHGIKEITIIELLSAFVALGERVFIEFFHLRHYPVDADDIMFVLCALNGTASHLVSYDPHLKEAGSFYDEFRTCEPLEFLENLRSALL